MTTDPEPKPSSFLDATKEPRRGIVHDALGFMRENAMWWLLPFLLVFVLLGLVLILGGTAAGSFLYTLW